jgi:hypothetical protein
MVLKAYRELISQLVLYENHILRLYGDSIACKAGCSGCCILTSVNAIEAFVIQNAIKGLSSGAKKVLISRLQHKKGKYCDLLIDNRCSVYKNRPVICRTHGYPLLSFEAAFYCEKNFIDSKPPSAASLLSIDKLNTALAAICVQFQRERGLKINSRRIAIRSIIKNSLAIKQRQNDSD